MKSLILIAVIMGLSSTANAFEYEGKWKAHCEWTDDRVNEVIIQYVPGAGGSEEQVEIQFNPGKFLWAHDASFSLFNEDYSSRYFYRYSKLILNQESLEYRLRSNYGGKDRTSIYLNKISDSEYVLRLSVNGSRTYEYKLTR